MAEWQLGEHNFGGGHAVRKATSTCGRAGLRWWLLRLAAILALQPTRIGGMSVFTLMSDMAGHAGHSCARVRGVPGVPILLRLGVLCA